MRGIRQTETLFHAVNPYARQVEFTKRFGDLGVDPRTVQGTLARTDPRDHIRDDDAAAPAAPSASFVPWLILPETRLDIDDPQIEQGSMHADSGEAVIAVGGVIEVPHGPPRPRRAARSHPSISIQTYLSIKTCAAWRTRGGGTIRGRGSLAFPPAP